MKKKLTQYSVSTFYTILNIDRYLNFEIKVVVLISILLSTNKVDSIFSRGLLFESVCTDASLSGGHRPTGPGPGDLVTALTCIEREADKMARVKTDTLRSRVPREGTFNQGTLARYLQRVAGSWDQEYGHIGCIGYGV